MEKELRRGAVLNYESDEHILEAHYDAEQSHGRSAGFKIWFNGTYVHISKTYKSFEHKLRQLIDKYDLEFVPAEYEADEPIEMSHPHNNNKGPFGPF